MGFTRFATTIGRGEPPFVEHACATRHPGLLRPRVLCRPWHELLQKGRRQSMKIQRRFTQPGIDPLDTIEWDTRESVIREPDGTVVFEMRDIEVPKNWSQVATDILAQKYFRKAGVPQADGSLGSETSARQVVRRLAGCWADWGRRYGYFDSADDAAAFDAEMTHMLINQMAAPNSPQWFNTGLNYAYGINGPAQGHYYVDPDSHELVQSKDAYTHPQPHACLPYHALVTTLDGPIPIGEIVEKNLIGLAVFDSDGTTTVKAVKHNGVKTVYRVSLRNGNAIEATSDHLVLVAGDDGAERWMPVNDLVAGMRLIQRTDTALAANRDPMAHAEAALAGWLQADGFVGQYSEGANRSLTVEAMTVARTLLQPEKSVARRQRVEIQSIQNIGDSDV